MELELDKEGRWCARGLEAMENDKSSCAPVLNITRVYLGCTTAGRGRRDSISVLLNSSNTTPTKHIPTGLPVDPSNKEQMANILSASTFSHPSSSSSDTASSLGAPEGKIRKNSYFTSSQDSNTRKLRTESKSGQRGSVQSAVITRDSRDEGMSRGHVAALQSTASSGSSSSQETKSFELSSAELKTRRGK